MDNPVIVSVSGWVVDFMMKVRHGAAFESGIIPTGFWAGITIGRLILGFATEALGEAALLDPCTAAMKFQSKFSTMY